MAPQSSTGFGRRATEASWTTPSLLPKRTPSALRAAAVTSMDQRYMLVFELHRGGFRKCHRFQGCDCLVQQPVSVAIEADRVFFQLYSGGVMTDCGTCGSSDHCKVEESWSESGYFRLDRSKGGADECGILSYLVVSSSAVGVVVSSFWRYTAECFRDVRFAKQRVKLWKEGIGASSPVPRKLKQHFAVFDH